MTRFSVIQIDIHPARFVATTGSARSAQILARLVGERCPGNRFDIREGGDFIRASSNGFIRDAARSWEVTQLAADELAAEADENPAHLPKWHVYFYDCGKRRPRYRVNAYLDHDLPVRMRCERDPELIGKAVHYGDGPNLETLELMLDTFLIRREDVA